ncbi:uncharacterized protein LOC110980883 isoform X2 [Acanthaster planci]|uniref:Uncharacterized protein LOC110980883 isoform X2 n=1 Tax=Acanthaster planci TaxID=133434 RepID=A0A8B7YK31_ACAPL|nr:uncharacterized protein LOC110980883 isoform X2 [Acanthaster planci]
MNPKSLSRVTGRKAKWRDSTEWLSFAKLGMPSDRYSTQHVLSFCLICLLLSCAVEQAGSTDNVTEGVRARYPNPWQDPEQCRRTDTEKSWICDVDGVLPKEQADSIDSLLVSINANASCVCNCSGNTTFLFADEGYVMGVAVVTSLEEDLSVANRTYHLERFGESIRQDWFANRTCDDSILILVHYMYNCSKIHISIGVAFDNLLSSQSLSSIYEAAQPSLGTGNIGQALPITVQKLDAVIDKAMTTPTEPPPPNNLVWGILGVIAVTSILLFHYWIKY